MTPEAVQDAYNQRFQTALAAYNRIQDAKQRFIRDNGRSPDRLYVSPHAPFSIESGFGLPLVVDTALVHADDFRFE